MTYSIGSILLIRKYKLPTKEKDKYFIVLDQDKDICNWLSMTTSQFYFSQELIKHGVINQGSLSSMYCFKQGQVIGIDGFAFPKHTFINHNSNIFEFREDKLSEYMIEVKDILINNEFKDLLCSFYKCRGTSKKDKLKIKNIFDKLGMKVD